MNCKDDALSNVLVDTGSFVNVLPKSTLAKLSYQGPPMRQSGMVVKAFDGSRKTLIGEADEMGSEGCASQLLSLVWESFRQMKCGFRKWEPFYTYD